MQGVFHKLSPNVQGIMLILFGVLCLAVMDTVMKLLLDDGFAVLQVLAVRSWFVVPAMALWAWRTLGGEALRTKRPGLHFVRVVLGFFAPFFFFSALQTMALADATVIFFGATFLMTALSVPILKEKVGPHRWGAVVVGFVGVLIALEPGGEFSFVTGTDALGPLYALLASLSYALLMLITRWMGPGEGAFKQVIYFHAWMCVAATAFSVSDFKPMSGGDVSLVVIAGGIAILGHLSLTRAFSIAPVGLVAPFEYTALVWATLFGFLVWGHVPGAPVLIGAAVIVGSGLYLLHRETRFERLKTATAKAASEGAPPPVAMPLPPSVVADRKD